MYGIDINFLNDRSDRPVEAIVPVKQATDNASSKLPIYVGLGVAVAFCAGVGGYWMILQNQQKALMADNAVLDSQLSELQQKLAQVDTKRQQTQAVESEVQALAGVFERIRPWSAIIRDVQNRIPNRTQLAKLVQTAPAEDGSAAGGLEIGGEACSFDDINDFLLTLKNSPFLESESVEITDATLGQAVEGQCLGAPDNGSILSLVKYTIKGDIKSIPAAALLEELNRQQEATGLAARIRALQATGAIE
ncbi:MAG: PilN domain-containing protein [Cyanobacteria bacterium P01_D01_bin.105]